MSRVIAVPTLTIQLLIRQADNSPAETRQGKPALLFELKGQAKDGKQQ